MHLQILRMLPSPRQTTYIAVDRHTGDYIRLVAQPSVPRLMLGPHDVEMVDRKTATDSRGNMFHISLIPTVTMTTGEQLILQSRIGSGSYGSVYLATTAADGRKYAVKVVRLDETTHFFPATLIRNVSKPRTVDAELESYIRIADVCPYVGDIVDAVNPDPGSLAVVLPFYPQTLKSTLDQGPVPRHLVLRYSRQLAEAVSCLQHMHIVHRDLKPDNIVLDDRGDIRIIDFGLAVQDCRNWDKRVSGTPKYLPPDIVAKGDDICAADVWSVGAIMFELLTGQQLASHIDEPLNRRFFERLYTQAPTLARSKISDPHLANLVASALAFSPRRRITSADLAQQLRVLENAA